MTPAEYDAWYDTPRGRWIGETEYKLLHYLLDPRPGDNILDVGCGTGWFTRNFAAISELHVVLNTRFRTHCHWGGPCCYRRGRACQYCIAKLYVLSMKQKIE